MNVRKKDEKEMPVKVKVHFIDNSKEINKILNVSASVLF